jgi:spoIIIJ-associated protein
LSETKYTLAETGPRIEQFLRPMLKNGGFDLAFEIAAGSSTDPEIENPEVIVRFAGRDVDLLLANRAELLLALEHITMEALAVPSEDHSKLSFDANDYRMLRIEELRMSALAAAEKVHRTGQYFEFNPMNSRERRVIHIALRNDTGVRSESLGWGPQRHVIVYPASMASLPEPPKPGPEAFSHHRQGSGGGFGAHGGGGGFRHGGPPRGDRDRGGRGGPGGGRGDRRGGRPPRGPRPPR